MKKIYLIITVLCALFAQCSSVGKSDDTTFVGVHGQLSVKGTALTDKNGKPVALHGVSFGWHNWWSKYYTPATVAWLKSDWNANIVRAAIGVEPDNAYLQNPELAMICLKTVVDAAIENDMYAIIDWHAHRIHLEEAKSFFTQVALRYRDYPNIIYEIFNEPWGDEMTWEEVKDYSVELIKTIRAIDGDNLILVGSPHWSQDVDVVADSPIEGYGNIMYTLHFYAATHKKGLRDRAGYALSKGLPVFVSECAGMEASGDGAIDMVEWEAWKKWMAENDLSWIAWSVSSKTETCSMIVADDQPGSQPSPLYGWKDEELQEWGKIVRDNLQVINK
ncbi:MAG: glycoside hydrolase family 5 protein [Tannerella sp.]|jgi:endoglucanase|nr:glycoside hydrolase family 5 protein [Tannerella sp.]